MSDKTRSKTKEKELLIISKFQQLIIYVYSLLRKYPSSEKHTLASETKKCLFDAFESLLYAKKAYGKNVKIKHLNDVDVKLSSLTIYIRIALKNNYINARNYKAWSYKITDISNMLGSWVNECLAR
ncbi:MAG: diversity-generating retroelement protein Avd [Bacilli bacterium]|nr:diversity-generating retroelement protein Avd [Bacilli bacterium]